MVFALVNKAMLITQLKYVLFAHLFPTDLSSMEFVQSAQEIWSMMEFLLADAQLVKPLKDQNASANVKTTSFWTLMVTAILVVPIKLFREENVFVPLDSHLMIVESVPCLVLQANLSFKELVLHAHSTLFTTLESMAAHAPLAIT